jgi:hypothetical protein
LFKVRTEGDAIAEMGRRLTSMVLTPEQVSILHSNEKLVCLSGYFGTGKVWDYLKYDVYIIAFPAGMLFFVSARPVGKLGRVKENILHFINLMSFH